jgi:hypothetical protein
MLLMSNLCQTSAELHRRTRPILALDLSLRRMNRSDDKGGDVNVLLEPGREVVGLMRPNIINSCRP